MGEDGWDNDARWCAEMDSWFFWGQQRWTLDVTGEAAMRTRDFLRRTAIENEISAEELAQKAPDNAKAARKAAAMAKKALGSLRTVKAVSEFARSNPYSPITPDKLDANKDVIGTPVGICELKSGRMRPARREDYITKHTNVAPTSGPPVKWLAFLDRTFGGDKDVIDFMQVLCGYALTGRIDEHKFFFLHGTGRNGKSVFLNTCAWISGDYSTTASSELFLSQRGAQHPTGLADLRGARFVVGSELPANRAWNESLIKDVTGGDVVKARKMYKDGFDFTPQCTLFMVGNSQPSLNQVDEAMRRRMVLVPFENTLTKDEINPRLQSELQKGEGGQILQWMIDGAVRWYKEGLKVPQSLLDASEEYMASEDIVGTFLTECTKERAGRYTTITEAHAQYVLWFEGQNIGGSNYTGLSKNAFAKSMRDRGLKPVKHGGQMCYEDLVLHQHDHSDGYSTGDTTDLER
jgi:P4 family phage/plasmid primase-like protien